MPATTMFVLCLRNDGYEVSLEPRKIYKTLRDPEAKSHGQVRVVDESGDDYLYPTSRFAALELSDEVRERLLATAAGGSPTD